jgi:hypothetical protein
MFDPTALRGQVVWGKHRRKDPKTYTIIDLEEVTHWGQPDWLITFATHPKQYLINFLRKEMHPKFLKLFAEHPNRRIRQIVAAKTKDHELIMKLTNDASNQVAARAIRRLKWSEHELLLRKLAVDGGIPVRKAALTKMPKSELSTYRSDLSLTVRGFIAKNIPISELHLLKNDNSYTVKQIIKHRLYWETKQ